MRNTVKKDLQTYGEPERAAFFPQFFKAFEGGYGEGDLFWGIRVPNIRKVAKKHKTLPIDETIELLHDPIHECRMCALFILIHHFDAGDEQTKKQCVDVYLQNLKYVNNWDLVDCSAHTILGTYLLDKKDRSILYKLAETNHLWSQRVSIVANWMLIRHNQFEDLLKLSETLMNHPHDLMHKAIGWMLREMGKKDEKLLRRFLDQHAKNMPRTMLRYSLEKLPEADRKHYMA